MFYTLACVLLGGEDSPRGILSRCEGGAPVRSDLEARFGVDNFQMSASVVLSDMPEVGNPGMEALYELCSKGIRKPESTANLLTDLLGGAIVFGYMVAQLETRKMLPGGDPSPKDPPDGDIPPAPDDGGDKTK